MIPGYAVGVEAFQSGIVHVSHGIAGGERGVHRRIEKRLMIAHGLNQHRGIGRVIFAGDREAQIPSKISPKFWPSRWPDFAGSTGRATPT